MDKITKNLQNLDKWNMNDIYLNGIGFLRWKYMEYRIQEDTTRIYQILNQLELEISAEPDADQDALKNIKTTNLTWLEKVHDKTIKYNSKGIPTKKFPLLKKQILQTCDETYRALLKEAQRAGILVKTFLDPSRAITRMGSS